MAMGNTVTMIMALVDFEDFKNAIGTVLGAVTC
jgi:hypothetical protein